MRLQRVERLPRSGRGRLRLRRRGAARGSVRPSARPAAIAPGPVFGADQGDGDRPLLFVGAGEDGERGGGGVRGRVGAADPGRVGGREGGIAEFFGAGARRFVGFAFGGFAFDPASAGGVAVVVRSRRWWTGPGRRPRPPFFEPLPATIARTMKPTAITTSAATSLIGAGDPRRRGAGLAARLRSPRGPASRDGASVSAAPGGLFRLLRRAPGAPAAPSTSALIGRSALTRPKATGVPRSGRRLRSAG